MPKPAISERVRWVEDYFRQHPTATVRDAVRSAYEARNGLHWDEVGRIHRQLLPELRPMAAALEQQLPKLRAVPHPPPEQRARTSKEEPLAESAAPAPQPTVESEGMSKKPAAPLELAMTLTPDELEHGKSKSKNGPGAGIRKRYLNAFLDRHPTASTQACIDALEAIFGQSVAMGYIYETRRLAAAAHSAPPVAAAPPPAVTPSPPPPAAPKAAPAPAQAAPAAPKEAPTAPIGVPSLQWGPQPTASLEDEFRRLAARLLEVCEREGVQSASLSWTQEAKVRASFTRKATLEF